MNILVQPPAAIPQRFVVHGVDWQTYEKTLEAFGNQPIRITYDRGSLELMSPLTIHEIYKRCLGLLLAVLDRELKIGIKGLASTTFRRRDLDRGLEPDECFYVGKLDRVHDWGDVDLSIDPPPDLALEVDVTRSCLNRLEIYAALGVPEVWRFDGENWHIHCLSANQAYEEQLQSNVLPFVALAEVAPFLELTTGGASDGELMDQLHQWVKDRVRPRWEAYSAQQSAARTNG
ncbi:MAG TPA: Uma2 family endonuclease [Gemmataceae bacterium]|nr:Uma2 family endonuclease [Gemmataceae bacterium]